MSTSPSTQRQLSCFTNSYGRFGPAACIQNIRRAGCEQVELAIKTAGVKSIFGEEPILSDQSKPGDLDSVRALLDQHDVSLSSCNITSGNPLDATVVDVTLAKLKLAHGLGVDLVVAGAGEASSKSERDTLYDHLRRIGDAAGELGITYCFETHPGLCINAEGMQQAMADLDHPHLRLNFDTGNILYYNAPVDVLAELRAVREWVRHVHLKDHNGVREDWHFPACGAAGSVDFAAIGQLLDEVGFFGPYSLEIEGIKDEPKLSMEETHTRVAASVTHLRSCGWD